MICKHFLFLEILINQNVNENFNSHCKYQLRIKGKAIKETRSWIKEHIRGLHLSTTFVYYFQKVKKIFLQYHQTWNFMKFPTVFVKCPISFFLLRYRCSKSAVCLNSAHKHRAHNFRRQCIYRARTHIRLTIEFKTNVKL